MWFLYMFLFLTTSHFHPSLIFVVKARSLPLVWSTVTWIGSPALLSNVIPGWNWLVVTNTLPHYNAALIVSKAGAYPRGAHYRTLIKELAPDFDLQYQTRVEVVVTNALPYNNAVLFTVVIYFKAKASGVVFTTFHFLHNLWMGPISWSPCPCQVFPL